MDLFIIGTAMFLSGLFLGLSFRESIDRKGE